MVFCLRQGRCFAEAQKQMRLQCSTERTRKRSGGHIARRAWKSKRRRKLMPRGRKRGKNRASGTAGGGAQEVLDRVNAINGENAARRAEADAEVQFYNPICNAKKDATEKAEREQTEKQRKDQQRAGKYSLQRWKHGTWPQPLPVNLLRLWSKPRGGKAGHLKRHFWIFKRHPHD